MDKFIANIDVNNFNLLEEASKNCCVKYEKGVQMKSNEHTFHPVFCKSLEDGVTLIKEYSNVKSKINNSGRDLILHEVIIKMLGI